MRFLVTGAKGFTGIYICRSLKDMGHQVFELDVNICDKDLVDREVKRINPEYVVHLAAISFVGHTGAGETYNVNVIGTYNLLSSLSENAPNIKSILLASSANVYGNCNQHDLIDETVQPNPANDYAVSKLSMEYMSKLWMDKLPIFIVRPFNYAGKGQDEKFIIPKITSHFTARKTEIELGNINVFREFNDVRFIADVYIELLLKAPLGQIINVCSGLSYSLEEMINICSKLTNHKIKININQAFVRANEVTRLAGCNEKLKSFVNEYKKYDLETTLKWMLLP